jgi:MATE family multidrug resistance protein
MVSRKIGFSNHIAWSRAGALFRAGGDILVRTALLTLFILIATRQATRLGAEAGAVHQGIRQVWMFSVLFLDGVAVAGQSLIAFYVGSRQIDVARRVALLVCGWSVVLGVLIGASMAGLTPWVRTYLVPESARHLFMMPWIAAILIQPVSALAFATDGIHWGTGDFKFLRNVTAVATGISVIILILATQDVNSGVFWIWITTGIWITIRTVFGMTRIWPGYWNAPLRARRQA